MPSHLATSWWRWKILELSTDPRCKATLPELWSEHTISDILDYAETLAFLDER